MTNGIVWNGEWKKGGCRMAEKRGGAMGRRECGVWVVMLACWMATHEVGFGQEGGEVEASQAARAVSDMGVAREAIASRMAYRLPEGVLDGLYASLIVDAQRVKTRAEHLRVMEGLVYGLGDHHVHLGTNDSDSPRLVPSGSSVWVEERGEALVVVQVRIGSAARRAGLREGMIVDRIDGVAVGELRLPWGGAEGASRGYAGRVAMAGTHRQDAVVEAHGVDGKKVKVTLAEVDASPERPVSLTWLESGVAWIRIHNQLGQSELVPAFEVVMEEAIHAKSILLDMRDTPSGGDSVIAKPIMSWFVKGKQGYQVHVRGEERWVEEVSGREKGCFQGRLVVLADHWTGSMGEGMTIGLRAAAGATYVGTPMAGLRGAMEEVALPGLRAPLRIPVERLFEVRGTPRELAEPDVLVTEGELGVGGVDDDVILRRGLEVVREG